MSPELAGGFFTHWTTWEAPTALSQFQEERGKELSRERGNAATEDQIQLDTDPRRKPTAVGWHLVALTLGDPGSLFPKSGFQPLHSPLHHKELRFIFIND